ncbi:protein LTV1 homolog [Pectinophora gossypiella]|uniref:Protein LTV1 homolog n=1 Tax=Pectinophora gossypiella TaxID=13191 RepID=A0A1E1WGT3_PECGO|nr:protein LTV1 homolog [Pectinophora gossypiella]
MPRPKPKKKFIDRKKAVSFNLVHRSQRDPLVADETAPQHVLVPINANVPPSKEKKQDLTPEQRRLEQQKYGIYFDDDYNYLQHLRDTKEVTMVMQPNTVVQQKKNKPVEQTETESNLAAKLQLPSSVFASEVEEDVGLLNKAASQGLCLNLDPEVVAALDEDFDFEDPDNQLEDNFIELAMGEGSGDNEYDEEDDADDGSMSGDDDSDKAFASDLDSDDDDDSQEDHGRRPKMPSWDPHDKDDTKSRFSQYSMSSSVIRRNEGLTLLDNRFEKMFAEYDDTEVGALDLEEIEGFMPETHDMLLRAAEEFEESRRKYQLDKEKEIARIRQLEEIEEESEDDLVTVEVDPKEKWDCETILSTYSNLYNHPKLIEEPKRPKKIQINPKSGIPKDVLGKDNKLTMKSLAKFNAMQDQQEGDSDEDGRTNAESILSTLSVLSIRPKDESPEEKKERKRLLKEYRKERRVEKKANKEAFKEEKKRQEKIMLNNRNNVQGNKIL